MQIGKKKFLWLWILKIIHIKWHIKKLGKRNECTVNIENISMNQIGLIYLSGRYF